MRAWLKVAGCASRFGPIVSPGVMASARRAWRRFLEFNGSPESTSGRGGAGPAERVEHLGWSPDRVRAVAVAAVRVCSREWGMQSVLERMRVPEDEADAVAEAIIAEDPEFAGEAQGGSEEEDEPEQDPYARTSLCALDWPGPEEDMEAGSRKETGAESGNVVKKHDVEAPAMKKDVKRRPDGVPPVKKQVKKRPAGAKAD